jgi:hypothetical protein
VVYNNPIDQNSHFFVTSFLFALNEKGRKILFDLVEAALRKDSIVEDARFLYFVKLHLTDSSFAINVASQIVGYSPSLLEKKWYAVCLEHALSGHLSKNGVIFSVNSNFSGRLSYEWAKIVASAYRVIKK